MNHPLRALRGTLLVSLCDPRRRMRDDHHEPVPHPERLATPSAAATATASAPASATATATAPAAVRARPTTSP